MKKTALGLILSLVAIAGLSFAGERYQGTITPGTLNVTGTYDAGAPGGVIFANSAPVGPSSLIALQTAGSACYCLNQIDANQVTNCSSTNCVTIVANDLHKTSCPPQTSVKIAATLPDGGTLYGNTNLCTIYVLGDAGVKVFTRQGNE